MRIALQVEYDGSPYHGWQKQKGLKTLQGVLETALSKVKNISTYCAGRTDTGVHAIGQIVHFETDVERTTRSWIHGANSNLPKEVCVRWAKEMPEDFHARHSAHSRAYRYIIFNSPIRPALFRTNLTWQYRQLDADLMHTAAQDLLGEQDFTSFRSVECQSKTPMRNVMRCDVTRKGDFVYIDIEANAFLHHMVRNIAGVLMMVGSYRRPESWVKEVLQAKDRSQGAETAPAYGLYLSEVKYPEAFEVIQPEFRPLFGTEA